MFKIPPDRRQVMLLPPSVDEYVSPTHRVRVIVEVVERLDLSRFQVGSADTGRGAFQPTGLVALLLYSFSIGVFSAREMARRLETDCAFLFATSGQRPSYRTIARFRTDEAEALAGIFAQVLVACRSVGLGSLDVVAIDGTRVRANASLDAHSRRSQLEKELGAAKEHVARLLAESARVDAAEDAAKAGAEPEVPVALADRKRRVAAIERALAEMTAAGVDEVNTTDADARIQRCKEGNRPGYNAQVAASGKDGLIVGCDVVNDAGDTDQLLPMVDAVTTQLGPIAVVVADGGYNGGANVQGLVKRNQDAVLAASTEKGAHERGRVTGRFQWVDFSYDPVADEYICPAMRRLAFAGIRGSDPDGPRTYRGVACEGCPLRARCSPDKPRTLEMKRTTPYLLAMAERRREDRRIGHFGVHRKAMIEGHFGHFKHNLRWRQFLARGLKACRAELRLLCAAYNLMKLAIHRGAAERVARAA